MLTYLGFVINARKSELIPSQEFTFLGVVFDLVRGRISPAPHRLEKFHQSLTALAHQAHASPREIHSL